MKIGLIQVDGELPNLALMKLSAWHKKQGHEVYYMKSDVIATRLIEFDEVYISCIFEENKEKAYKIYSQFKNAKIGGVGVNNAKLSHEIDHIMPDYTLLDIDYSMGFTTRGCVRKCSFCKVPDHEGGIRVNSDIYEFWDKKHKKLIIQDNNILALPKHFNLVADQILENDLQVDFNQGLDHRLLNLDIAKKLLKLKHIHEIRFAYDHIAYKPTVLKAISILKEAGVKDWQTRWYLYIGENDTFKTVYERMDLLRQHKQAVYVMRDKKVYNEPMYIALSSWGNTMGAFKLADIEELTVKSERMKKYRDLVQEGKYGKIRQYAL